MNKALVVVGDGHMFMHVMRLYERMGIREFILSCGSQAERFDAELEVRYGARRSGDAWEVPGLGVLPCRVWVLAGAPDASTGDRIRAAIPLLGHDSVFAATYSDTITDVDLGKVRAFHVAHGRLGTLLATDLPTRFRIIGLRYGETVVRGFADRLVLQNDFINGGFYFFRREVLDRPYWPPGAVLEEGVLEGMAAEQQLEAFSHRGGTWQHLDSERDMGTIDTWLRNRKA